MSGKKVGVFGIYSTRIAVENATDSLMRAGFPASDISVLLPESLGGPKDMGTEKATKAPEGTAVGVTTGGVIGGTLGLLAGVGLFPPECCPARVTNHFRMAQCDVVRSSLDVTTSNFCGAEKANKTRKCADMNSGKHHVVVGQLSWHWGYARNWRATPLAVDMALDTSRRPRPSLLGFPMLTSNRSDFRPYTRNASVTISNRRVRTRMHGGVAGVGGQPPPLCRSNGVIGNWLFPGWATF